MPPIGQLTQETMKTLNDSFQNAFSNPLNGDELKKGNIQSINSGLDPQLATFMDALQKAGITMQTGLVGYNLSETVTNVNTYFPGDNLLSSSIVRNKGQFDKARFKRMKGSLKGMSSSPEGGRGTSTTINTEEISFTYKTTSHNFNYTLQSQLAGQGFKDPAQVASMNALFELRRSEEFKFLGGNITSFGAGVKPSLAAGVGGSIAAGTWSVKVAAIGIEAGNSAYIGGTDGSGNATNNGQAPWNTQLDYLTLLPTQAYNASTNAYAASTTAYWNVANVGAATTVAVTTSVGSITATWASVAGAMAYAVFAGPSGSETLQIISTNNACKLTQITSNGSATPSADGSADALSYDGIIPQVIAAGVNGENVIDLNNSQLSALGSGAGEIDAVLDYIYGVTHVVPDIIYMSPQIISDVSDIVLSKGGVYNYVGPTAQEKLEITAGLRTLNYVHKRSGKVVKLQSHIYMPDGSALFLSTALPALTDAPYAIEYQFLTDYMQLNYAVTAQQYNADVLNIGALIMRYPKSCGLLKNVKKGVA